MDWGKYARPITLYDYVLSSEELITVRALIVAGPISSRDIGLSLAPSVPHGIVPTTRETFSRCRKRIERQNGAARYTAKKWVSEDSQALEPYVIARRGSFFFSLPTLYHCRKRITSLRARRFVRYFAGMPRGIRVALAIFSHIELSIDRLSGWYGDTRREKIVRMKIEVTKCKVATVL